jgi:uncharacterized protein involved in exopolysaccharide biosynthesis
MGLLALFSVLNARKLLMAVAVAVAALIALLAGVVAPKQYKSTAKVQVDSLQQNLLTGYFEPRVRVSEFLGQQAAVAGSRTVALQVYDQLLSDGYFLQSDFEKEWRAKTRGELVAGNDARLWAADQLLKKLSLEVDALESTLSLSFLSDDPAQSARVANAFANFYMHTVMNQRQRRAARNAAKFSDETSSLEEGLEVAQRELTAFRKQSGIVGLGAQRLESIEVELASVTIRLAEARADLSEADSLLRQAQASGGRELLTLPLPEDAQSGRQAQARLGGVLVQLQRLSERYGEKYPNFIEATNEKRALERTIMKAVEDRAEFAARRVSALEETTAQQKEIVVDLQETKQQYDVLEKRVQANRDTYDLVTARSLQESLQSRVDTVDVLLLARAVPSERPITPPLAVIILIGVFAGLAIGSAAAVAVELVEGRVRTKNVIAHLLRAPVIAELSLPAPAEKGGFV